MRKCLIIFSCLFLITASAFSQKRMTAGYLDTLTYKKYIKGDWDAVTKYGRIALKNNIDFYYLRCRMGYAYYMKKQFRASAFEYENALKLSHTGTEALEYLYYSYIENQEFDRASKVYKLFNDDLKSRIHSYKIPIIKSLQMSTGLKHTSVPQSLRDLTFSNLSISHHVGAGLSLFHQFSGLHQDIYSASIHQYQYYLSAHIPLKKGLQIMPSYHFIKTNVLPVTPTPPNTSSLAMLDSSSSFVAGILISKSAKMWELGYTASVSNFNNGNQTQQSAFLNLFPLKNNQLSIGINYANIHQSKVYQVAHIQKLKGNRTNTTYVDSIATWSNYFPKFQINYKPIKQFEIQLFYTIPNSLNTNEMNGLMVNNSIDKTNKKMGAHLQWNIYKNVSAYFDYQYESRYRGSTYFYNLTTQNTQTVNAFSYFNHIVFGGIKINLY